MVQARGQFRYLQDALPRPVAQRCLMCQTAGVSVSYAGRFFAHVPCPLSEEQSIMRLHSLSLCWPVAGLLFACFVSVISAEDAPRGKQRVYVGTYNGRKSRGIYRAELDLATGKLSAPVLAAETVNPSFLA